MFIRWGLAALLLGATPLPRPPAFFDWPTQLDSTATADTDGVCQVRRLIEDAGLGTPQVRLIQSFVSGHASYRVTTSAADLFVKLPCYGASAARQDACLAEFAAEREWAAWAADRGLAPPMADALAHANVLATQFVAGQAPHPEEARVPPLRPRILQALRDLHQTVATHAPAGGRDSDVDVARTLLRESHADLPASWLHDLLAVLERELAYEAHTVCHNDFHHRNILVDDPTVFIIDWGAAGPGDPMADVARFVCNLDLPIEDAATYLNEYQGSASPHDVRHLQLMMTVLDAEQYIWCSNQSDRDADAQYFRQRLQNDVAAIAAQGVGVAPLP